MFVPGLLVHGQRNIVPAETVPGGAQPGRVLGPVLGHRAHHVAANVAHQRRAGVLHGDIYRAQGVRHAQHGVADDGVMSAVAAAVAAVRGKRDACTGTTGRNRRRSRGLRRRW